MKKVIISFYAMLIMAGTLAQKDCKYDKNETDKFTHKKIVWTKWENFTTLFGSRVYVPPVRLISEDTLKQLLFYIEGFRYSNFKPTQGELDSFIVVPAGSKVIFMMEDQKVVELTTAKQVNSSGDYVSPYTGENRSEKFQIHWFITMFYPLKEDLIKALAVQPTTSMRLYFKSDNFTDYNFHKKKYSVLQNLIPCFLDAAKN